MRHCVPLALVSLVAACSPAAVTGSFDASTDSPAVPADQPLAADAPIAVVDAPPAVDAGTPVDAPAPALDSGVVTPVDAGSLPLDGGSLGEPMWVPLDVRTGDRSCPPLAPCGGNESGTWDVGGGCIDVVSPMQLMSCPGARIERAMGRARGRVVYAGGFARRASQWEIEMSLFIPQLCAAFVGGCSAIESIARATYPGTTCTTEAAGNCRCQVRQSGAINDGDRYTVSGTQFISASSGKRWNYCIAGNTLRYEDVSPSGPREVGIIELTRRAP
jgi:hypothetical protein